MNLYIRDAERLWDFELFRINVSFIKYTVRVQAVNCFISYIVCVLEPFETATIFPTYEYWRVDQRRIHIPVFS